MPSNDPAFIGRHYHGHLVADFDDWREDATLVVIIEHEEPVHSDSITCPSPVVTTDGAASLLLWRFICLLVLVELCEVH